jgi:hypothetical protein
MQSLCQTGPKLLVFLLLGAELLATAGCSAGSSVQTLDVDPQAASEYAMEHYDANGDGALEASELSRFPPLAAVRLTFDTDGDDRLSSNEIADGVAQLFASPRITEMTCTVTLDGRPLAGAKVRLRPAEMLGDTLPVAEGVTDQRGNVRPTIDSELLPEEFKQRPLVYAGLYRVEITHPRTQLASRYNTMSELGCYVDPAASHGMSAQFDLRSK